MHSEIPADPAPFQLAGDGKAGGGLIVVFGALGRGGFGEFSFCRPLTVSPNITIRTPPAFRMKSWYVISTCPIRLAEAPKATNTAVRPTIKNREFRTIVTRTRLRSV